MTSYITKRLLTLIPVWILVSLLTFVILHLVPGDPVTIMLGPGASAGVREQMIQEMGLDQPFFVSYFNWISDILRGNLGRSYFLGRPVSQALLNRLPVTAFLGFGALIISILIGLPAGIIGAIRRNSFIDSFVVGFSLVGMSTAEFVLGLVLIFFFSVQLGWFPTGGYVSINESLVRWLQHLVLPSFTLGFIWAALIARMTRATMMEVIESDYITTARSKGLTERVVIIKHALRVAMIDITTVIGFVIILVVGGAFITEIVFTLPGIGRMMVDGVLQRDYPLVQGGMIFIATGILLINLFIDLVYAFLDPRIKYE